MKNRKALWLLVPLLLFAVAAIMVLAVGKRIEPKGSTAVPSDWSDVRSSAGHSVHVGKEGIACTSCHSVSDAGFQSPGEGVCAGCHKAENAASHKGSVSKETPCLTCHAFGKKESVTCISCHATAEGLVGWHLAHAGDVPLRAIVAVGNHASVRVLEKVGFAEVGQEDFEGMTCLSFVYQSRS